MDTMIEVVMEDVTTIEEEMDIVTVIAVTMIVVVVDIEEVVAEVVTMTDIIEEEEEEGTTATKYLTHLYLFVFLSPLCSTFALLCATKRSSIVVVNSPEWLIF